MFGLAWRYLISSFIPPFLGTTVFFVAFLLAFQLFRIIGVMIQKGVEGAVIIRLLGDISLSFLPSAVPLAVFVAALYGIRRRSQDQEIVALHSLGFSRWQLIAPFFFLSLLIAGTLFSLQMDVIPQAKSRFKNTVIRLTNRGLLTDIREGMFFTDIPNLILFAHRVDGERQNMGQVFINRMDEHLEQFIFAEKGSLVKEFHGMLHPPSLRLYLTNGNMLKISQKEGKMEKVIFEEYDFPLGGRPVLLNMVTKDSMRSWRNLIKAMAEKERKLEASPDSKKAKRSFNRSLLEYWLRIQTPFQCIIFMFWGTLLGLRSGHAERRRQGGGGKVFLLLTGYHGLFLFAIALVKQEGMLPWMAVVLPNTLALLAVMGLLYQSGGMFRWLKKFS